MTVTLGDITVWQLGETEPGKKGGRSLKDVTGCGSTVVLTHLVLRAWSGMSVLPSPETQTKKLCILTFKSLSARDCLSAREASMAYSFLFQKQICFSSFYLWLWLLFALNDALRAFSEAVLTTCEVSPLQGWLLQAQGTDFQNHHRTLQVGRGLPHCGSQTSYLTLQKPEPWLPTENKAVSTAAVENGAHECKTVKYHKPGLLRERCKIFCNWEAPIQFRPEVFPG